MQKKFQTLTISKKTPEDVVIGLARECDKTCGKCCTYGSGFLAKQDFPRIAKLLGVNEEELKKGYLEKTEIFNTELHRPKLIKKGKPYGVCIFYNKQEGCTIHSAKPLQCKATNPCSVYGNELDQWFMLNYAVNPADPESIRQWALYLKFNETIPGGELNQLVRDSLKLKKILSYEILK